MNSCMPTLAASEQMRGFVRDKQAWENAIAVYQGPDPLDHWYNYVCWYENHARGDPEHKYRETLERCLALFEHSDYYKQDTRMVRLWLKYIDMQPHPLHFYQVLYQRGVGRQVAAFYISWAGYYESINAMKEAESVYSLAFQEKAQSYADLHHAHSKFQYMRTAAAQQAAVHQQQQQQTPQLQHHPIQQQQQQQQQQQLQQSQTAHYHANHGQTQAQLPAQHQVAQVPVQSYHHRPQQPQQAAAAYPQQQQQHHHQSEHMAAQQGQGQAYQQQPQPQQQQHQVYQQHQSVQYHNHVQQQQHHSAHNQYVGSQATASNYAYHGANQISNNPTTHIPVEQKLPAASSTYAATPGAYEHTTAESAPTPPPVNRTVAAHQDTPVPGIRLPRKFSAYCRNNYETWKPALFLEEPDDPSRHCHYAKNLVYPGTGVEYSPEELRSRKYTRHLQPERTQPLEEPYEETPAREEPIVQELQEIGAVQKQGTTQCYSYTEMSEKLYEKQRVQALHQVASSEDETVHVYAESHEQLQHNHNHHHHNHHHHHGHNRQQTQQQSTGAKSDSGLVNTLDDLEDQIEASTIRFDQNKTIKIKFKKERHHDGNSLKGNYVIESSYHQEISSPSQDYGKIKNGHSFHPYSMDHTSTPKSSTKRSKTKLKQVNKYPIGTGSSSNSSSADNGTVSNGNGIINGNTNTPHLDVTDDVVHNATFNDNANYSFSSAVALDNSNCSLTSAVDRLNFRDTTGVMNTSTAVADASTYQENSYFATQHDTELKERRLRKALEIIEQHLAKDAIDPFNSDLCRAFLTKLNFPGTEDECANYKIVQTPLPKIANTRTLLLPDGMQYNIDKEVGRGSYGSVYKAIDASTGSVVALKFQKPPNTWEIYICDQVLKRVRSHNILPGLMDISAAIIAPNASLIATEFSPFGSLLDINNKIRQATTKVMHESLVMHFSAQICNIIHHLHVNKIIHADIKPDNFLLMRIPSTDLHYPSLRLIDFGCAIDMTLFPDPDNTKFLKVIQTDGFTCIEMQEGRPWSYETDLFCIAGTVHVMLLGEYMQLQKRGSTWDIKQKLPRYLKKHVWTRFFNDMLNIKTAKLPDLNEMRKVFEAEAARMDSELQSQIRTLSNILYRR